MNKIFRILLLMLAMSIILIPCAAEQINITITQPTSGTNFRPDAAIPIKWTYTGNIGSTVSILILPAGGTPALYRTSAGSGGQGRYDWKPPVLVAYDKQYVIKVFSDQNNSIFSITTITVQRSSISITQPASGATVQPGVALPIRWTYIGDIGQVMVDVFFASNRALVHYAVMPTANGGYGAYDGWKPNAYPSGTQLFVRVYCLSNQAIFCQVPITVLVPTSGKASGKVTVILSKCTNINDPHYSMNYYNGGTPYVSSMNAKITSVKNISQSSFILWLIDGGAKQSPDITFSPGSVSNAFNGMKLNGGLWGASLGAPYPILVTLEVQWTE